LAPCPTIGTQTIQFFMSQISKIGSGKTNANSHN
jgi:hypothetical protein